MAEYKLANGSVITDDDINQLCQEFETESWVGRLERIHVGPAAVADEPLVSVTIKFPESMVAAIDAKTKNRSDFIRKAVAALL
ncbi:ribbon-helix-helix domain-containing protein [Collinsella sp. AGMB00827]|uniref:Ribbon-helix-helix domain-containing protein n=1 Tax=Collinsella ureilytica TaxID=2869515 RepID=A0ABS7MI46_9ACTN|nr:ribbon-helix-helix domain-containing protein [Collinsella urealyticum]MBY4797025.1 ribbon-helix-helix domain-containing protein [Collinsella urealyticum]